jgi:hypothetical protein
MSRPKTRLLWVILLLALALQAGWKLCEPLPAGHARNLPSAPDPAWVRIVDFGEHALASQWLMLQLFSQDEQPGVSLPFASIDYARLKEWLGAALELDPDNRNLLLAATQVYSQVPDSGRQRMMLDFVHQQFLLAPDSRWPFLAHASFIARHGLQDMNLALSYARDLSRVSSAPAWARQMSLLLLADMGEKEQARVLLGGLLDSGAVKDPREIGFLLKRIDSAAK